MNTQPSTLLVIFTATYTSQMDYLKLFILLPGVEIYECVSPSCFEYHITIPQTLLN